MVSIGQVISGKYKLLRLLGDGGMGSVYEAEHLTLGTHVAIKVLHGELARRAGIAERFLQEARVSAQIRSPHVVQVVDVDRTPEGAAYLVMELLQGETLSGVVRRQGQLQLEIAAEYAGQILQALESAHALGVIHRDLKPDNVFVTFQGGKPVLKLIDFGIAKLKTAQAGQTKNLTVAGMLMGTPEYMAPEQGYAADKVDVRADLYAVGVMLYEMLSGKTPASAEDPRVLILKVERGEIVPLVQAAPGVRPEVAGFVHRAMAPRPELRFASATEMRLALEAIVSGKRPATAKVDAMAFAQTADAAHKSTGTVMAPPAAAALAAPGSGPPPPMAGGTVAPHVPPPGQFSHVPMPPPGQMSQMPAPAYTPPPAYAPPPVAKKSGSGLVIALAVVAALLGAGAVVAYVVSTQPSSPVTSNPTFTTATTTVTTATTTAPPVTATTPVTPVTPLTTVAPPPPTPVNPPVTPRKDAGAPAVQDAGWSPAPSPADAGGQTTIVTPFGTIQIPGPRPPFWPPDQPWPPPVPAPP